jgi:betaine-aldehyde dehydrogenase
MYVLKIGMSDEIGHRRSFVSMTNPADVLESHLGDRDFKLVIGGELVESASGDREATIDPSTGLPITTVPWGGGLDVDRAVTAALAARAEWRELGLSGRSEALGRLGAVVARFEERLAAVDSLDGGLPHSAARKDVIIALHGIRDWPSLVRWHGGRTIPASDGNLHYTHSRPYGVVGRIVPFNHPAMFAIAGILPALLAGNTIVLKPAPQTPLSAMLFGDIAREVLPPGVINVVTGGAEVGAALAGHPEVKRIAFTGSVQTGMEVQRCAATGAVKHVSLELGGKNAMLVFPDADLDDAVNGAVIGMNFGANTGQSCGSNSRVFVHADIYERFLEAAAERLDAISLGIAYRHNTEMGPLVSEVQRRRVARYIDSGVDQGARLVVGGSQPISDPELANGYFLRPTLFADVDTGMTIAREEIFGPVMSVFRWDDYQSALRAANDTSFGLTASVWTNDLHLAHKTAESLEVGYVWINDTARHYFGTPFGGMKNSGVGREECIEEYESYLEQKAIHTVFKSPGERLGTMIGRVDDRGVRDATVSRTWVSREPTT